MNQIVFQMIDDWHDWKEDLSKKQATPICLCQVFDYCKLENASIMEESHVRRAFFIGNAVEKVFEMALAYNQRSKDN